MSVKKAKKNIVYVKIKKKSKNKKEKKLIWRKMKKNHQTFDF